MKHLFIVSILMVLTVSSNSLASQDDKNSSSAPTDARGMSGTPGTVQFTLSGHTRRVKTVAWSPDGTKIVTTSGDETAKIWSAATGALLTTIQGFYYMDRLCWSPDGSKLAGKTDDSTVTIWAATSGNVLFTLNEYPSYIKHISWSPDGSKIAVNYGDSATVIWSGTSATKLLTLDKLSGYINVLRWSPDGTKIATAGSRARVNFWSTITGEWLYFVQHTGSVNDVDWSPDGTLTASASDDYTIVIASASTGDIIKFLVSDDIYSFISVRWHPDGKRVLTTNYYGKASIWSTVDKFEYSYEPLITFVKNSKRTSHYQATPALWSPDFTKVLATDADSTAQVWSAATGALQLTLQAHNGEITSACWSPDGARIATASDDSTAKVWYITDASGIQDSPTLTEAGFSLFPNPTDNSLHLSFATENAVSSAVQICDLLGRTVATADIPAGTKEWTMSVGNLPAGVYVVRWGGGVRKLVVR
ncbi:MAG: PD40 domain-containing protein [Ignavibacteria bacterium]|nr:PD40 domain-containing protein [Ignavibacteria bacterium]